MNKWLAILLAMVFIGASTQCLAECADQASKVPPCHQHTQSKCSIESQLVASSPDTQHSLAIVEPIQGLLASAIVLDPLEDDFSVEPVVTAIPPLLTILRI